jgi:hypothetical protein
MNSKSRAYRLLNQLLIFVIHIKAFSSSKSNDSLFKEVEHFHFKFNVRSLKNEWMKQLE